MIKYKKYKRRWILILFYVTVASCSFGQKQSIKLPPFQILQENRKIFKAEYLPMGKPIMVIYFSPDCDHCKSFIKELLKQSAKFKKASVALITYEDIDKVKTFYKKFAFYKYPNIYIGTEGTSFFVRDYYKIVSMPFVALHNKNGDLIQSFQRNIPINTLMTTLQKLN
jgi:thiol-disulfide isomerase/thioredoxin